MSAEKNLDLCGRGLPMPREVMSNMSKFDHARLDKKRMSLTSQETLCLQAMTTFPVQL